jgi:4-hydroxybenzoate polyprenyltransferase
MTDQHTPLFNFFFRWRPLHWRSIWVYELISFTLMYASMVFLAHSGQPVTWDFLKILVFSIISLFSGYFAALIWNDINDRDIDSVVHPDRPLPGKRMSAARFFAIALVFSASTFLFAYLVDFWCFLLVGFTALFVAFHNRYFKKGMRLPAYSEIFTPLQWCIVPVFGYLAMHYYVLVPVLMVVLFTYFADSSHDIAEGIHDVEGDSQFGVRTYATSFGESTAAKVSFAFLTLSGVFGIAVYFVTPLSLIYLIGFVLFWIYTVYRYSRLLKTEGEERRTLGPKIGKNGFDFLLFVYDLIFLDLIIQILVPNLSWLKII